MGRLIATQKEMQEVARAVRFCYLCGTPLRCSIPRKQQLNGDHVIPTALLGPAPSDGAWPVKLNVHQACHDEVKNSNDESLALLHKLHQTQGDIAGVGWASNLGKLKLELFQTVDPVTGEPAFMMSGIPGAYSAIWTVVRGMHAVLYRSFLPDFRLYPSSAKNTMVFAPRGEAFLPEEKNRRQRALTPDEFENHKSAILRLLSEAETSSLLDEVVCWDNRCRFSCTWLVGPNAMWYNIWCLQYPDSDQYAEGTRFDGCPGWLGCYRCRKRPDGCSELRLSLRR